MTAVQPAPDLAATIDAYAAAVAERLARTEGAAPVSVMVIGDEGVEERFVSAAGEVVDAAEPGAVDVRFELVEDVAELLAGTAALPGMVYAMRAELSGEPAAVNAVAPAVALSDHRFVPYVTRASQLSDAELQALLDDEGIPSLLRRVVEANAFAFTLIDLVSHIGEFRTRWSVGGHEMDSVAEDGAIRVVDFEPDAEVGSLVTFEPLAWIRWLGTTCAPPPTEAEAANEITFIDGLLSGKFQMVGNTHSLEAVSRLLPNSR